MPWRKAIRPRKRWTDADRTGAVGWEMISAQTGASERCILLGNNTKVPAYRWWDREQKRTAMSGNAEDALALNPG